MDNRKRIGIIIIILTVLFMIIGGTLAYWNWRTNSSQRTAIRLTVTTGYTCLADGGGNITSNDVSLAPAECTNSTYAIKRAVKVTTIQDSGATIYLNMNLKVNNISATLSESQNFKYSLTTSSAYCESGIMAEGSFYGVHADDELPLLTNERYLTSTNNDTFYLWIWLDKAEINNDTQNEAFDFTLSGSCTNQEPAKMYAPWGAEVDQYTRINFSQISSASNGQGLYLFQQSEHDTNPIYYYRGAVNNNNVLFGNYCWKIVRTTETGGVKIIYSGTPTSGSCINTTGTDAQIGTSVFNSNQESLAYVGYMYGTHYTYSQRASASLATPYKYGNSFTYSGGTYTLVDTIDSTGTWSTDYNTLNNNHYTCFNDTGVCSNLYYIYYTTSGSASYITLTGGKSIEMTLDEMLTSSSNTLDSPIKSYVDNWYTTNLANYENNLEDTVWCNDRSIYQLNGWNSNGGNTTKPLYFKPYERIQILLYPRLTCKNFNDSFTKNGSNGNGSLSNPVGLLTVDEGMLAGGRVGVANNMYYLYTGQNFWFASPRFFNDGGAREWYVNSTGHLGNSYGVNNPYGVRPSVSLKSGGSWSGDGTPNNPYKVSYVQASSLSIALDDNSYEVDDPITVTATLSAGASGSVTFTTGTYSYSATIQNGVASYTITDRILSGDHTITATYGGDANYTGSSSSATFTVSRKLPVLRAIGANRYTNQAEVITVNFGFADVTGIVTVSIDGIVHTGTISVGGAKVVYEAGELAQGSHTAFVTYEGDEKYLPDDTTTLFVINQAKPKPS